MSGLPRTCIIGAGSSGIAGAKALHEHGVPFDCFEASDRVGGNWVFGNRNGMSAAYRDLHINTSRERMEYGDFPMPKSYSDFPHHTEISAYFDAYVDHFGFRDKIAFETAVEHAQLGDDGVWEVTLADGERRRYDALIVANGHHWDPRWPEPAFPGQDRFAGEQIHAHSYVDSLAWRDKSVVVLGIGNSAVDIAVEASYVTDRVLLASRRGAWVMPKYFGGIPLDQVALRGNLLARLISDPRVPWRVQQWGLELTYRQAVGEDMRVYGMQQPDHRLGDAHPTVSGRLLDRIAHGRIAIKPNIAELTETTVKFVDGSEAEADVVVWCTGYKVTFPFFDEGFISAPDNDLPLFRRVFHPEIPSVAFLGLLQPLGAIMPLSEAQARWVAQYLRGEYRLPQHQQLLVEMEKERERMFARYVASKRHTMQVDFDRYLHELAGELRRGARRAREAGFRLPVPPRAAALESRQPVAS